MGLECTAKDCPSWKSANTADPYEGYCIDERVLSCYRRSMAKVTAVPIKGSGEEEEEDG